MDQNYTQDDFLARWAEGSLSEEEAKAFKNTSEYALFEAILAGTDAMKVPTYDKERLFQKVKTEKIAHIPVVRLIPKWVYVAVASIALLLGGYWWFNASSTTYTTNFGEQLTVHLPDASTVILNAHSEIQYTPGEWSKKRTVKLQGDAFFKVQKGSRFLVDTEQGVVKVLGTTFSASAANGIFETICFEGMVEVSTDSKTDTITQGEAIKVVAGVFEKWHFQNQNIPSWIHGESSFTNAPLPQVIQALENQYGIQVTTAKVPTSLRYSGSFTHSDLEKALKTVCHPLGLGFRQIDDHTVELYQK
ncbi:MAG: FecR domain-containing protein [Bacteroidota bacterium]